jgi:hypothetical protein
LGLVIGGHFEPRTVALPQGCSFFRNQERRRVGDLAERSR